MDSGLHLSAVSTEVLLFRPLSKQFRSTLLILLVLPQDPFRYQLPGGRHFPGFPPVVRKRVKAVEPLGWRVVPWPVL